MHIPLKQLPARSPVCSLLFWLPQPSSPSRKELQPELCPSARPCCSRAACKYTPSYEDAISLSSSVNFAALRMAGGCCQEKAAWEGEKKIYRPWLGGREGKETGNSFLEGGGSPLHPNPG